MIFEITLILLHTFLSASAAQQNYPSTSISKYCHLYSLHSNKNKQFILLADKSRKFSKKKPVKEMNGNMNYMFTIVNGKSLYDKKGNLVYSTVRLIDTKSNRTLCQTRSKRRPVFKKTRYWRKFPRKCQYRELSKLIQRGKHENNYHFINDAFKNYLQWRNFGVKYTSKRVRKMRRKMDFIPEISFHKDCTHTKITSFYLKKEQNLKKIEKKMQEGRRDVRLNNKSRKKRNPYRNIRSPAHRVLTTQKAVILNHRRNGKDDT